MGRIKNWEKRTDNRPLKVTNTSSRVLLMWKNDIVDEVVFIQYNHYRERYSVFVDNPKGVRVIGTYNTQKDAIGKAMNYMKSYNVLTNMC